MPPPVVAKPTSHTVIYIIFGVLVVGGIVLAIVLSTKKHKSSSSSNTPTTSPPPAPTPAATGYAGKTFNIVSNKTGTKMVVTNRNVEPHHQKGFTGYPNVDNSGYFPVAQMELFSAVDQARSAITLVQSDISGWFNARQQSTGSLLCLLTGLWYAIGDDVACTSYVAFKPNGSFVSPLYFVPVTVGAGNIGLKVMVGYDFSKTGCKDTNTNAPLHSQGILIVGSVTGHAVTHGERTTLSHDHLQFIKSPTTQQSEAADALFELVPVT